MASSTFHNDDREDLSALFDGELDADGARFALKRLGHDAQWRETCGRWQMCGDVLRSRAQGRAAPGFAGNGFADRVAAAIAADAALQAVRDTHAGSVDVSAPIGAAGLTPRRAAGSRRGWIGGAALAASVAVAALFVARPFSDDSAAGGADPAQFATQTAATAPAQPSQPVPAPQPAAQDLAAAGDAGEPSLTSADASGIAAAAVAVAEIPRRLNERRSRGQSQRAAIRASDRASAQAPLQLAAAGGAVPAVAEAAHANPFRPQQSEAPAARPWPRAVLPVYQSAGSGYVASYGNAGPNSPSFYPFEPATHADELRAEQARLDQARSDQTRSEPARIRPPVQERPQPQP